MYAPTRVGAYSYYMTKPSPPAEAVLIEQLRRAARPRLAARRAAELAGLSEARWRQIAQGYQQINPDTRVDVRARDETLARMAWAVGATPEQLNEVGREDAGKALLALIHQAPPQQPEAAAQTEVDSAAEEGEIYELEAARSIQHTVDTVLGTAIPFTDDEIAELNDIRATAGQLPQIFGKLLDVPMGRRELMRNCISLQRRITEILRNHSKTRARGSA